MKHVILLLSLVILFVNQAYAATEKNLTLTIYSDQYTICHLDKIHHYSAECWLVPTDRNIRDYLEALSSVR